MPDVELHKERLLARHEVATPTVILGFQVITLRSERTFAALVVAPLQAD